MHRAFVAVLSAFFVRAIVMISLPGLPLFISAVDIDIVIAHRCEVLCVLLVFCYKSSKAHKESTIDCSAISLYLLALQCLTEIFRQ